MNEAGSGLRDWVDAQWPHLTVNDFSLKPEFHQPSDRAPQWQALPGDAGFRKYYRLASDPPLLAVYAPSESEDTQAFLKVAKLLRTGGVLAPAVAACDLDKGYLLIEDLGPTLLFNAIDDHNVVELYRETLGCLLQLQCCEPEEGEVPDYSAEKLRAEMELFRDWFVPKLLGYEIPVAQWRMLDDVFEALVGSALEQPQVLVHRDFHSRNLIYRLDGPPGVIDFQDAVVGPITYDLVSLLRDCYLRWPDALVRELLEIYHLRAHALGLLPVTDTSLLQRWFDWMGLQRHIKVLGIFSRLSLRDNKHGYLKELPRVIGYVQDVVGRYPELEAFGAWFEETLMPIIREQPWYLDSEES